MVSLVAIKACPSPALASGMTVSMIGWMSPLASLGQDNKLRFRDIKPLRLYQDNVLVQEGLQPGERVCISPIQTAIEGMQVSPTADAV